MLSRRRFLRGAACVGAAVPLSTLFRRPARAAGFGALEPDPAGILDLPPGFSYRIVDEALSPMDDGYRVPASPDGMACFAGGPGQLILLRNHEVSLAAFGDGPYNDGQSAPPEAYDALGMGGVTRVVLDATTLERISSNLVLTGTVRNCAGGPSPWGWLTCEENVDGSHGYVFVCPADADRVRMPRRVDGYGRFNHEAVAVDPATAIAYLTEDRLDSCLYRFVPVSVDDPFNGRLQAMKIGDSVVNLSQGLSPGDRFDVTWVDIDDPTPVFDTVRNEARGKGAALIVRGEGIWHADGRVYICSTSGGPVAGGQIFVLDIASNTLELLGQSTDRDLLDMPDNITVAPWGDVYMAEDGDGEQFIRSMSPDGSVSDFARNAGSTSELAGVCFSPDGKAMFLNIQKDGLTLAITGPFPDGPPPTPDPDPEPTPDPDPMPDPGDDGGGCGGSSVRAGMAGAAAVAVGAIVATRPGDPNAGS